MGYIFVYKAMRSNLKNQAFAEIAKLPDEILVAITFPTSDKSKLIIEKNRIEIKLNDGLYDVVKTKIIGDNTTYFCVRDIKEEQMIRSLSLLNQQNESERPAKKAGGQLIDHLIKIALLQHKMHLFDESVTIKYCLIKTDNYKAPFLNISVPPPLFRS